MRNMVNHQKVEKDITHAKLIKKLSTGQKMYNGEIHHCDTQITACL